MGGRGGGRGGGRTSPKVRSGFSALRVGRRSWENFMNPESFFLPPDAFFAMPAVLLLGAMFVRAAERRVGTVGGRSTGRSSRS